MLVAFAILGLAVLHTITRGVNARMLLLGSVYASVIVMLWPALFLILLGLATRFSALALLGMTLVIQLFVYPDAYPTHGTWIALLLLLMAKGPGSFSIDHLIARRYR